MPSAARCARACRRAPDVVLFGLKWTSSQGAGYSTSKYEPGLHGAAAAAHDRKVEREQGQ